MDTGRKVASSADAAESGHARLGGLEPGLAIVRRCVEACGGNVTAANCERSGLEVKITLPRNC